MKKLSIAALLLILFISCKKEEEAAKPTTPSAPADYNPGTGWTQAWSEEFNDATLNTSLWNYDIGTGGNYGWGNNELQYYRSENLQLIGGNLVITANREDYGGKSFTSSRINTKDKYSFKYGKVVSKIKVPEGYGVWPAFWMLGATNQGWPACGEIDILEATLGQGANGDNKVFSTCHWQDGSGNHQYYGKEFIHTAKLSQDYHYYEVEWNASSITARFDGIQYFTLDVTSADVSELKDNPYFIILNLAIGGNIFSPAISNPSTVTATFPQRMYVDWVRVYQK